MTGRSRPRTPSIALAGAGVFLLGTIAVAGILVDRAFARAVTWTSLDGPAPAPS